MVVVMTNESVSRGVKSLSAINTSVKGHVKKITASERENCNNVQAKQNSLGNFTWSNG